MRKKRILFIVLIFCLIAYCIYYANNKYEFTKKNVFALTRFQDIDFPNLRNYYLYYGHYPDSLEELNLPRVHLLAEFYDPFADDSLLKYMPIKIDDINKTYIVYSVGPDGEDNSETIIANFNKGKSKNITFTSLGYDVSFFDIFKSCDIIIRPPNDSNRDKYFKVKWISREYQLWDQKYLN